jgi:Protein of unknown function (DUF3300)
MRKTLSVSFGLGAALALLLTAGVAPAASAQTPPAPQQTYADAQVVLYSADQLDNLVAPVALYADPLLAQVLLASTFPDEVVAAAQYVRTNGTNGIDDQYWDVSVKAVAHYPTVLNMMDTRIDWTTSLGQAYAQQSTDVMQSVQHMRQLAQAQGNLESTQQQQVVTDGGYLRIWPAQPQYIYVPVYDPDVIYFQPVFRHAGFGSYFSFGIGYPIGAWLMYDWDWPAQRIIYTGWYGGGWIARSRPYIRYTSVYVNAGYRHVRYDHDVIYRRPDYGHVRVYRGIGNHRVDYVNHMDHNAGRYAVPRDAHGVVVNGSGYHPPRQAAPSAHVRVMPQNTQGQRRMPAATVPQGGARTASPRRAPAQPSPMVNWRRAEPSRPVEQRPARVQPRYTAPQSPARVQPRYTAPQSPARVQPRYTAPQRPVRVEPRYTAPRSAPQAHAQPAPRYSAPRSAPQPRAQPAPSHASSSHSAPAHAAPRGAHKRGSGNE